MKKRFLSLLLLLVVFTTSTSTFSQTEATTKDEKKVFLYDDGTWEFADTDPLYNIKVTTLNKLEIPQTIPREAIVSHTGYSLSYNEIHEQANWVAYELTKEKTNKIWERTDKFQIDPKVKTGTANNKDYSGSGYDRGHLAPASDMGWSATAMAESFYYSNMSPQEPGFNRGIWKRLEELVRTWAVANESIYVVTAPVLTTGLITIGKNKVSIPKYFYKVILDYKEPSIKGIGFIIPNGSSSEQLQLYAVSIDSVQKFTGINFFPSLPDEQENIIESTLNLKSWIWKSSNIKDGKEEERAIVSVQCNGLTKSGIRCKNKTLNVSGYCYRHEEQINNKTTGQKTALINETTNNEENEKAIVSVQCNGVTKKGTRCKNKTLNSNGYCYRHVGQIDNKNDSVKATPSYKTKESKSSNSSYYGGKTIQTGPRGGKYYINKNGNKTYVKKKY